VVFSGDLRYDCLRVIRGTVVYHDYLEVAICLGQQAFEALPDKLATVVSSDDYADGIHNGPELKK
jgi:hypothetical protein